MELINTTRMQAGFNVGLEASGRELLVVVIKGTFVLPKMGESVRLHDEQVPLVMADTFTGKPGFSAPVYESDFAPRKHACDVLLCGQAHAPSGQAVTRLTVGMQVGALNKSFDVVGARHWSAGVTGIRASEPEPFVSMPLSYDLAFGGVDVVHDDPAEHDAYGINPVGKGFHKHLKNAWVDGKPLPCTEATGQAVTWPHQEAQPMAFGPLGRGWAQRACYAGTYDQQWQEEVFPFLPKDFDERYFQAAPLDQQIAIPQGPLAVRLHNLSADGLRQFELPHFQAPVQIRPKKGEAEQHVGVLDTIVFEPDLERFTLTWRVTRPLKHSLFDIAQAVVGRAA